MSVEEQSRPPEGDEAELRARVDLLQEENRRLRREYARAKRTRYRRTALGFVVIGGLGLAGAFAFPNLRTVLLALGATGLFAAVLTYYLTPERFVSATVADGVYSAYSSSLADLVSELGLSQYRYYVPTDDTDDRVRLYIPQAADHELPTATDLSETFVADSADRHRGLALSPTGLPLYREFDRARTGPPAESPGALLDQLTDGLVELFELADSTARTIDEAEATIGIDGSTLGDIDRFDHPIPSFLAVGLSIGLDTPVTVEVHRGDDRHDALVTLAWQAE